MDISMNMSMNMSTNTSTNMSTNMSMSDIDNITLNYFSNKSQFNSILKKTELMNDKKFITDKKFYKKRVLDLTKRLFRDEEVNGLLFNSFNVYINNCIKYLKFEDKRDIIQDKYASMDEATILANLNNETNITNITNLPGDNNELVEACNYKKCDHLFSKPEDVKQINLDTFVIRKTVRKNQQVLPKKEHINIKTKEHKTKGIVKKKNVDIIYEEHAKNGTC